MFDTLRLLQVLAWGAALGVGVVLGRRLFRGAIDGGALIRRLRGADVARIDAALSRCPRPWSFVATMAEADDPLLRLREQTVLAERWVTRGLAWLRIVGLAASALGFIAVAQQISWLRQDHGLLDLDPARVGRLASERAAIALALAISASGTSMMLGSIVRRRAATMLRELSTLEGLVERAIERRAPAADTARAALDRA